ncbi:MAG: hypothetical protein P9L90_02110 [Candidatus Aadella gelida]|nr:hypothetical protein [Candidatus Aadella gelida]
MKKIALRPFEGSMAIKGFKIFNPSGYKEKILADVSLVLLDFKIKTLFEPGAYFDKIELHIDKLNLIRDKEGTINIARMEGFGSPKEKSEKPFLADKYIIEIEKVYYIDRTKEVGKQIKEIDINERWEFDNVQDPDNLINVVIYKVFVGGKIIGVGLELQKIQKKLVKLAKHNEKLAEAIEKLKQEQSEKDKQDTQEKVDTTVEAVKEAVGEQTERTKEAVVQKVEDIKEAVDKTAEAVMVQIEKSTEEIKEKAENIAGGGESAKSIINTAIGKEDPVKEEK